MDEVNKNLNVVVYQLTEKFNEIASKGRARIFYRGKNRNNTYITEEFAEKLISTVSYTPVKGIWDDELKDFTDHGYSRTDGKIYGVVLENPNFAWEDFEDEDGIIRTYACVDVIVYTAIYPEAQQIIGKSLSMEILPSSITGKWTMIDGERFFEFSSGAFAGLQALGDAVEPCFEGAQFFTLFNQLQELCTRIKQFNLKTGGNVEMPINFKLSDGEKFELIWKSLNPDYTEEGNWTYSVSVCDVYDEYAVCYDYETGEYFRQYYTKNENAIELGEKKKCFIMDVSEEEYNALNALKALHGGSFTQINEEFDTLKAENEQFTATIAEKDAVIAEKDASIEEFTNSLAEKDASIEELNVSINSLNENITSIQSQLEETQNNYSAAQEEVNALKDYKYNVEKAAKEAMINKYSVKLDDEIVKNYMSSIDNYAIDELEKLLSYELVKATPSIFSLEVNNQVLPKDAPITGIAAILEKYK